jgi:hypothetical protein
MADPEPVPARDLEVADRIARAVRRGRPVDRRPTLDQVLAAFGEREPTPAARRRAARALALAGVATVPDLLEAPPGQRVTLEVREPRRRRPLLLGTVALLAVFGATAALASTLDTSRTERAADPPAGTDTATATEVSATTEPATDPAATAPDEPSVAERRARERRARERRARERRARERERRANARAAARRRVTVRLTAAQATFLCVEGDGRELFNGTLSGSRSFRARVVRLNVGLVPSTRVTANGRRVPLTASPTGVQITPRRQTLLPLGERPCA